MTDMLPGDPILLAYQLHDGATDKYCRAHVKRDDGTAYPGSPFGLTHAGIGLYLNNSAVVFPGAPYKGLAVTYEAFEDAGFLTPSPTHYRGAESFLLDATLGATSGSVASELQGVMFGGDLMGGMADSDDLTANALPGSLFGGLGASGTIKGKILEEGMEGALVC